MQVLSRRLRKLGELFPEVELHGVGELLLSPLLLLPSLEADSNLSFAVPDVLLPTGETQISSCISYHQSVYLRALSLLPSSPEPSPSLPLSPEPQPSRFPSLPPTFS